jgi:alpha-L-fucosidase
VNTVLKTARQHFASPKRRVLNSTAGIIPPIQQQSLRVAGKWLKDHSDSIFNTTFWSIASSDEANANIHFTQTLDAFYIFAMSKPNVTLTLHSPVPYKEGDRVSVVGGKNSGVVVPSSLDNGVLSLYITDAVRESDEFAWVFKITYQ